MLLAPFVLNHRLRQPDPFEPAGGNDSREATNLLLSEKPVPLGRAIEVVS